MEKLHLILAFIAFLVCCQVYVRLRIYYWYSADTKQLSNKVSVKCVTKPSTSDTEGDDH